MIRHAFLALRPATADDFKDKDGNTLYGAVYFIQNCNLTICKKLNYMQLSTNKVEFKELFNEERIFVFANPDEVVNVDECTVEDWNEIHVPVIENQIDLFKKAV
jgi:hypothetical protein